MPKHFGILLFIFLYINVHAQYPLQAGKPGSTAIHRDSSIIINWATRGEVKRGWQHCGDTGLGKTTVGDPSMLPGAPGNGTVSLGDGGEAVLTFEHPIRNGVGYDFVVFENGFIDQSLDTGTAFLELAFVEASSDGIHYFRFPAVSLNDTTNQLSPYAGMRAEKLHNLAGKYIAPFGTPFNLDDLPDTILLNKQAVTHIRVVDVIGSLNNACATRDVLGNKINDPWPTAFPPGGFDLDAVGVIHEDETLYNKSLSGDNNLFRVYPNPAQAGQKINIELPESFFNPEVRISNILGELTDVKVVHSFETGIQITIFHAGLYFVAVKHADYIVHRRIWVK